MTSLPVGYCHCGCGQLAPLAKRDDRRWGLVKGEPCRFVKGHNSVVAGRVAGPRGYMMVPRVAGSGYRTRYQMEHIAVVERALGHPLPEGAEVHHVDGDKANNANTNLVACQDDAYHKLLHLRARALAESGHADWRRCTICKRWDEPANLKIYPSCRRVVHMDCQRVKSLERFYRLRAAKAVAA